MKERNCLPGKIAQQGLWQCVVLVLSVTLLATCLPANASTHGERLSSLKESGKAFAAVAKTASPAVVFIQVEKEAKSQQAMGMPPQFNDPFDLFGDDFMQRFFGDRLPQRQAPQQHKRTIKGQGSGFIISKDGYILTNNHVVGDADKVTVKLADDREFEAKVVGTDPHGDVAVIRIDAKDLPVIPLGNSDVLEVGEWVLALGNPFGLSHTLTAGIVSAKGRNSVGIADYEDFIQTDAAINPGNSGGPLLNLAGEAIGINTAIYSRSGGYMGIGFAIPINMAKHIRDQLIENGKVSRGYLGVMIQPLTPELAESFGIKEKKGILIGDVSADTPAEKAGLKQGDVVTALSGKPVAKIGAFRNDIALLSPGTTVYLTVIRDGKQKEIPVKLGELPDKVAGEEKPGSGSALEQLGMTVQPLTPELAEKFGYVDQVGVLVSAVTPGSAAAAMGLHPGVLIQEVNRHHVSNVKDFKKAVEDVKSKGIVLLLVRDGEHARYVALQVEH